jgi:hypothetical protein
VRSSTDYAAEVLPSTSSSPYNSVQHISSQALRMTERACVTTPVTPRPISPMSHPCLNVQSIHCHSLGHVACLNAQTNHYVAKTSHGQQGGHISDAATPQQNTQLRPCPGHCLCEPGVVQGEKALLHTLWPLLTAPALHAARVSISQALGAVPDYPQPCGPCS